MKNNNFNKEKKNDLRKSGLLTDFTICNRGQKYEVISEVVVILNINYISDILH